ncbi:MAG TPA: hypothetical protein VMF13_02870, partial [Luteitalea sp.]|nr:hypothetical protein [Luteitalea sp.]
NRRGVIGEQLVQAEAKLRESRARLETFRKQAQVEMSRKDADELLDKRARLITLQVQIAADQARLAKAEEELTRHERVRTQRSASALAPPQEREEPAPSAPGEDAKTRERRREQAERDRLPVVTLRSDAVDPFVNPVHEYLDQQVSALRTRVAAGVRERDDLQRRLGVGNERLQALSTLYEKETGLKQLETEYEISQKTYVDFATIHEASRVELTGRSPQLVIVDRAMPPEWPVSRNVARNALLGAAIALLAGSALVLLQQLIREVRSSRERF